MEPTTRVDLVTCRLRIVRIEGTPRDPNPLTVAFRDEISPDVTSVGSFGTLLGTLELEFSTVLNPSL